MTVWISVWPTEYFWTTYLPHIENVVCEHCEQPLIRFDVLKNQLFNVFFKLGQWGSKTPQNCTALWMEGQLYICAIPAYEKYMTSKCSLRVVFSDFWSKEKIISSNYRTNEGHQPNYKNTVYSVQYYFGNWIVSLQKQILHRVREMA